MVPADGPSAEHRELLLELSLLIAERRGVDDLFAAFANHVRHGITFDYASLFVVTADPAFIRSVGQQPELFPETQPGTIHRAEVLGADLAADLVDGGEYIPKLVDVESARSLHERGFERAWVTPLLVEGQSYGMLTVAKFAKGRFPEDHLAFLRAAARLLARAVHQDLELGRARQRAVRAQAANELILALQAHEPYTAIFERLPALLENGLEVDYVGLVINRGYGFVIGAEVPAGVHLGLDPTPEGTAYIESLAKEDTFFQFRPRGDWSSALAKAGYERCGMAFLRDGEELRGLLLLARQSGRKFDEDEQRFIAILKAILSQSLANQRRLERTETGAARALILNEVALLVNAGEAIETIFERLTDLLDKALEIDYLGLLKATEDPAMLVQVGSRPELVRPAGTLVSKAAAGYTDTTGLDTPVNQFRLANWSSKTDFARETYSRGLQRSATVLIRQGNEMLGLLTLARKNVARFSEDEEAFLGTLSAMLGQAIGNQRRLVSAQTEAARNGLLNELAILLNKGEPASAFFQSLSAQLKTVVPFDGIVLLVADGEEGALRVVDSSRRESFRPEARMNVADFGERVLRHLAAGDVVVEGPPQESGAGGVADMSRAAGTRRGAIASIQHGGEPVGYFMLARQSDLPFTPEERSFIELVCTLVGQAIANRRKVEEKEAEAIRSQVLSELAVLLQGGDRIEDHFDDLCAILLQAVGFDFVSVTTRDPVSGGFAVIRTHELDHEGRPVEFDPEAMGRIQARGGPIMQFATDSLPQPVPTALHQAGYLRAASAVIISPDGSEGIFTIGRREDQPFSAAEMGFIELVSALLGQAAANYAKAHAGAAEALRSRVLGELALLLNNGEPIDAHFQRLRERLLEGVGFDFCSIAVRIPGTDNFRVMRSEALAGSEQETAPVDAAAITNILETGGFSGQYGPEAAAFGAPAGLFRMGISRGASFVLTTGREPEGLLTIGRRAPEPFRADEMAFFEVVASLLANVAANERRLWLSAQEAEDQAIAAEAGAAVARESDPIAIAQSLAIAIGRFMPDAFVRFAYLEADGLVFHTLGGGREPQRMGKYFTSALASGQAVVPSLAEREAAGEEVMRTRAARLESHILTRADSAGTIVGFLLAGSRDPSFLAGERELRLCQSIADIVGPAMANARAAARERSEAEEQAIIAAAAAAVAGELDPLAIVRSLREAVRRFIPQPFVNFGYLEEDSVSFPARDGLARRLRLGPRFQEALRDGQSTVPGRAGKTDELEVEAAANVGLEAHVATRAMSGGSIVGLLIVGSRDPAFVPQERDRRLCRLIADMLGPAMANSRALEREREEAEDQAIIAEAAAAVARETTPLAIVRGLRAAAAKFIGAPFVNFGYLESGEVRFPSKDGLLEVMQTDVYFTSALKDGQAIVPSTTSRVAAGETNLVSMQKLGIESHVVTRAMSAGSVAGLLVMGSRDPAFVPGERELRLSRLIADIVGPAMANARSIERERMEAEEQRILAQAAAAVAASQSEADLIAALEQPITELIPQSSLLFFYVQDGRAFSPTFGRSLELGPEAFVALGRGQAVADELWSEAPETVRAYVREQGIARWAYTTAKSGGDTLGLFMVTTRDTAYRFSERDLRLFRVMADFATPALENLRESARRKQEAEEQRILAEAAAAIASGATEDEILARLVAPVRRFVPRARVAFSYVEGDETMLWDGRNRRPLHAVSRRALETGQVCGDARDTEMTEASRALITSAGVEQFCDTAATSAGVPIGLLFVGSPDPAFEFSERGRQVLRLIADIAGPAMINARADRRRREEAEDERLLSEVAGLAARSGGTELIESLPGALNALVPDAFVLYGFIDGETIKYQITRPAERAMIGMDELTLPLSAVGRTARTNGQAAGSLAATPPEAPYAKLGLQQYVLTTYATAGGPPGVLMVSTPDSKFQFTDRVCALLKRVVQVVGPAVESSRAEAERARQAELYGLILRSLSEGVILSDVDGHVVFANKLGRRILRALDPEGATGHWRDIARLLPQDAQEGYRGVYERSEPARGRASLEVEGETAWFEYELVPLNDPIMKILVVAADVTADVQRESEQARHREQMDQAQRLAALGELIGGVAHELNNPLTAILGFAEVMALSSASEPLKEEIGIVQKEALRARNIVRDLLFIVRPGTTERSLICVHDLVGHIERLRRADWVQQEIRWESDLAPECTVWGNEHQLTQVLLNLITNAEHALAAASRREISVRARCLGETTELSITDTGAGMDEATRNRVFEPFFTTKQGHGTGLGLPLSYSIVQAHRGEIRVESTPGAGTTFTVVLPSVSEAGDSRPALAEAAAAGKTRVLVVDDEPSLRKVCQRLIASMGHECATAENASAAISLAEAEDFDVVLCDYRLATETADQVIAGFEQVAPHLIARTIIATGATTDAGVVGLTERYGLRLMAKPYGMDELAAIIRPAGVGAGR